MRPAGDTARNIPCGIAGPGVSVDEPFRSMKSWSFKIANIGGTEVRIHFTFLLLLLWVGWSAAMEGGADLAINAVGFVTSIFFCVLLHEFGHVLAARRYGIQTPDITLLPIGGVARLERMPREPWHEFVVAICGPLVNVVIATVLSICLRRFAPVGLDFDPLHGSFVARLMQWNLIMVVFNLIPAFPMDGGRVLRALLAMFMDYGRATRMAASVGQGIAGIGFLWALLVWHNPILLIIAIFIFLGAGQEAAMVSDEEAMSGLTVRDAMMTEFHTLREDATLGEAVEVLIKGSQHDFPVLGGDGEFVGILTRTGLIAGLSGAGSGHAVAEAMEACEERLDAGHKLTEAMQILRASPLPALPVMDGFSGRVIGLLTAENIAEMLLVRNALRGGEAYSR